MYQALYRKWRPRTFDEVAGQPQVTETLKRQVETDRLSHAYLFTGTRGTGKTSCAKILAKAVNCENPASGNPCNICSACTGIDSGAILDVEELDAASNNGVDNVRALRDEAVFTPAAVKMRVYIIDEVHMLSTAAFNALLKILEEPPVHLMFILATTEAHKVPATILSRCQQHTFKRVSLHDIAGRLLYVAGQEGMDLTEEAARLIARLSDGGVRDALSLLDQCACGGTIDPAFVRSVAGLMGSLKTAALFRHILAGEAGQALAILNDLYFSGKDVSSLLEELSDLIRDLLLRKIAPENSAALLSGGFDADILVELPAASPERLLSALSLLSASLADMARGINRKLAAELCLIRLCDETLSTDHAALLARISRLEERLSSGQAGCVKTAALPSGPAEEIASSRPPAAGEESRVPEPAPIESEDGFAPKDAGERLPPGKSSTAGDSPPKDTEPPLGEIAPDGPADRATTPELSGISRDIWPDVLARVKEEADIGIYAILSSPSQITVSLEAGVLLLAAENDFVKGMVERPDVIASIRSAAEASLGQPIPVKITTGVKKSAAKPDKLDALSKFGNTTFR